MTAYFELKTPQDMLAKARREYERLRASFVIDNVFNFFVTAYHIEDYLKATAAVDRGVLHAFMLDQDIKDCRDLCDKGKHLTLTHRSDPSTRVHTVGAVNTYAVGTMPVNGAATWRLLISNNREINVEPLAARVLKKWEDFFAANGL